MAEFKDAMIDPKSVEAITGPSGNMVAPEDVQFEDITDPAFDVKTFGKRAGMAGQYIAVPLEAPLLLMALIEGAKGSESLDQAKVLLDKAREAMALIFTPNQSRRVTLIEHQGKKIRIPV
jgi:hypothetical protein